VTRPTTVRPPLILLGGGGHAAVVADAARAAGWSLLGYLDDADRGTDPPRLGTIEELPDVLAQHGSTVVHAAIGDPDRRASWLAAAGVHSAPPIIHPTAVVSPSVTIDRGVFIGPGVVINARSEIGEGAIVNSRAVVEHDCRLGPYCHVAPGAVLGGIVRVGRASLVGLGAIVLPGRCVGDRASLGAGSVAISDVPDGATAVGAPAQLLQSTH
jgi:sugar O-acyltransferase (sialic acid O-acetyltransferase NeuD family)